MAHYALIDQSNFVVQVITGKDEGEDGIDWEQHYGDFHNLKCKRTSYNTRANVHANGGTPFRKNYAGFGYTWDEQRDAFIPPQPYASWTLNEETCLWESPIPTPEPIEGFMWIWNESALSWHSIKRLEV